MGTISIKDVAKLAGVSVATASRALSGKGYSGAASREKVQAAADQLNYHPNRAAKSLRENKTRVIGLIISDIRNSFFSQITKAVEDTALKHGYSVLICNTDEKVEQETRSVELMRDENVAGILISPTLSGGKRFNEYLQYGIPMVAFDRKPGKAAVDTVLIDNTDSARQLTRCILNAGYQNIAGIFGKKSYTSDVRLKGLQAAMTAAKIKPVTIMKIPPTESEGERAGMQLLESHPETDAVVCSSALLGIGAYKSIRRAGKQPGFACFDDASWTEFTDPPTSVISQPTELIGSTGIELLLKRIETPSRPVSEILLKGTLIDRTR